MAVPDDDATRRAIAAIYDAAIGARAWSEVSGMLRRGFDVEMTTIEIVDLKSGAMRTTADILPDDARREYEERMFLINPRVHIPNLKPLTVYGDRHHAETAPNAPEFYDWIAHHRLGRYSSGGAVMMDADFFAVAAMLTSAEQGRPSDEQEAAWGRLLPFVAQALAIERTLAARNRAVDLATLDRFDTGPAHALIDEAGTVVEASDRFRRIAKGSGALSLAARELRGRWGDDRQRVARLLASLRAGRPGAALRLRGPDGGQGVVLRGIPLNRGRDLFARLRPAALLTLVDLDAPAAGRLDDLRAVWALTLREAQVAQCLADGLTLEQTAARLRIGIGTVRHHLKGVFQRMDVDRQSEVVRLVRGLAG